MKTTGIVLAGGRSQRMGRDKSFIAYNGKLLFEYSAEILNFFCDTIIISSANEHFEKLGYTIVADKLTDCGPLCGIYSCLSASQTDKNLLIPCDTPFVPAELFTDLLKFSDDYEIVVPINNGFLEPLIGVYSKKIVPIAEKLILDNKFKILLLFDIVKTKFVEITPQKTYYNENMFKNFNEPKDLE